MLKPLNKCLRAVRETIQLIQDIGKMSRGFIRRQLLERAEASGYAAETASTVRIGVARVRFYEHGAARELQREGHGIVQDGFFSVSVCTLDPGVRMAMELRALSMPRGWNG
jgi:hypothetical protein